MEDVGKIWQARAQGLAEIIHVVVLRIGPGQDSGVRSCSQRDVSVGPGKHDTLLRQGIQMRGKTAPGAQKSHAVGASGVQSDQDHVGWRGRSGKADARRQQDEEQPTAEEPHKKRALILAAILSDGKPWGYWFSSCRSCFDNFSIRLRVCCKSFDRIPFLSCSISGGTPAASFAISSACAWRWTTSRFRAGAGGGPCFQKSGLRPGGIGRGPS